MNKVEHLLKISICGNDVNECSMFDLVICEYIYGLYKFYNIPVTKETDFSLLCNLDSSRYPSCMSPALGVITCILGFVCELNSLGFMSFNALGGLGLCGSVLHFNG